MHASETTHILAENGRTGVPRWKGDVVVSASKNYYPNGILLATVGRERKISRCKLWTP